VGAALPSYPNDNNAFIIISRFPRTIIFAKNLRFKSHRDFLHSAFRDGFMFAQRNPKEFVWTLLNLRK
jgi:hypothetical protein